MPWPTVKVACLLLHGLIATGTLGDRLPELLLEIVLNVVIVPVVLPQLLLRAL